MPRGDRAVRSEAVRQTSSEPRNIAKFGSGQAQFVSQPRPSKFRVLSGESPAKVFSATRSVFDMPSVMSAGVVPMSQGWSPVCVPRNITPSFLETAWVSFQVPPSGTHWRMSPSLALPSTRLPDHPTGTACQRAKPPLTT